MGESTKWRIDKSTNRQIDKIKGKVYKVKTTNIICGDNMKKEMIEKILKYANDNPDGFTIEITNGEKIKPFKFSNTHRYAVSMTNNDDNDKVIHMLKELPDNFNGYIGGWMDKELNKYYIDLTIIVESLTTAFAIGVKFKQKAIWDGIKNKEIKIKRR